MLDTSTPGGESQVTGLRLNHDQGGTTRIKAATQEANEMYRATKIF